MTPTFKISNNAPSNILLWNNLANLNSNFFQSTNYDKIQALYKNQPVYFELWSNENLIAGVKLYYWESNRLGFFSKIISKYIFQYSELLFNYKFSYLLNLNDASSLLQQSVNGYIKANDIVTAQVYGAYGNTDLLLKFKAKSKSDFYFNSAYVEIGEGDGEEFLQKFNRNTKRNLKKAVENELEFSELNDPDIFHKTLQEIFNQQIPVKPAPHKKLTNSFFNELKDKFDLSVHQVKKGNEVLAVSLFVKCGANAYSLFGGSIKNEMGAGHFLYCELMKIFKKQGITKFYFGQVAKEENEDNKKFSVGITGFKKGFGLTELPCYRKTYIFNPVKNTLWEIMKRVVGLTASK